MRCRMSWRPHAGIVQRVTQKLHTLCLKGVQGELGDSPAETLARFKAQAASTTSPPGPMDSWVGETIIHAEDIRRPLGIVHSYAPVAVRRVADFYKGSNTLIGAKNRIAGVAPACDRHRLVSWFWPGGQWSIALVGHGHDRTQGGPGRP